MQANYFAASSRANGKKNQCEKGPVLAPEQMAFVVEKLVQFGATKESILITERGTQFGYRDLVVDMRSIPLMQQLGVPVVMDATHAPPSSQPPTRSSRRTTPHDSYDSCRSRSGRSRRLVCRDTSFTGEALSDGSNMLPLHKMDNLLQQIMALETHIWKTNTYNCIPNHDKKPRIHQTVRKTTCAHIR